MGAIVYNNQLLTRENKLILNNNDTVPEALDIYINGHPDLLLSRNDLTVKGIYLKYILLEELKPYILLSMDKPSSSYTETNPYSYSIYPYTTITLTTNMLMKNTNDFLGLFSVDNCSFEYYNKIYNSSLINTLNLELLYDGISTRNPQIELLNSISNYRAIFIQGIYKNDASSSYNTTKIYVNPQFNQQYWTGMKDRNTSYRCLFTFIDDQHVGLSYSSTYYGFCLIYGMP